MNTQTTWLTKDEMIAQLEEALGDMDDYYYRALNDYRQNRSTRNLRRLQLYSEQYKSMLESLVALNGNPGKVGL